MELSPTDTSLSPQTRKDQFPNSRPSAAKEENEASAVVEFALRTFAFGLFNKVSTETSTSSDCLDPPTEKSSGLADHDVWDRVEEPRELGGAIGFTTLACSGGGDRCLGITPEGDVHSWAVRGRGLGALSRGFGMDWSLSVLKDDAGHLMQLRDLALGWPNRSKASSSTSPPGLLDDTGDDCSRQGNAAIDAVALMDTGEVYTAEAPHLDTWQPVPSLQSHLVVNVSCGSGFCIALTARGELWAWGESECGALGLGYAEAPTSEDSSLIKRMSSPSLVRGGLAGARVAAVACGDTHAIAATLDEPEQAGSIFSWGCGLGNGARLGYPLEEGVVVGAAEPREIEWITTSLAEALLARREHYGLGSRAGGNTQDSLGANGSSPARRRSSSLRTPQRITQLGCGSRHSVVLCQGSVICFGDDDYGQLGRGSEEEQVEGLTHEVRLPDFAFAPVLSIPSREVPQRREVSARRVCCGSLHTASVSAEGHLHSWGLDIVASSSPAERKHTDGVWLVPGFGGQQPVVTLACGSHFIVVSAEVQLPAVTRQKTSIVSFGDVPVREVVEGNGNDGGRHTSWRPANLPPKTEEESTHHEALVRELEKNIQQKLEREQREDKQRKVREERRERRLKEHTETWMTGLLPSYVPGSRPQWKMEHFWRQGLPPRVREVLWPLAIGNVLRITPELYEIHLRQAADARRADEASAANVLVTLSEPRKSHGREQSTKCIPFDLPRTFPTLAFFSEGGPLHQDCARILEAYTFFRPDIGYVQGMSYLAAMLLLYLPSYPAFVGLCNLINTPSVLGLYRLEPRAVECRSLVFQRLCAAQMPAVAHRLFNEVDLRPEQFLLEWFMTLYAKCLSIDVASVIWDLFFLDGEVVLYCTALALLRMLEPRLLSEDCVDLEGCLKILGQELRDRASDPDEVLTQVHEVWRRAPTQLLTEIKNIEATEFSSTTTHHHTRVEATPGSAAAGAARALLSAWRSTPFSRWMMP